LFLPVWLPERDPYFHSRAMVLQQKVNAHLLFSIKDKLSQKLPKPNKNK